MILPRRQFLNLLGVAAGAAGMSGCRGRWAVPDDRVELALRGPGLESQVQSICGLCSGGCGLSVRLVDGLPVGIKGNPNHPLNAGGACPVGLSALDILYSTNRLQSPLKRTSSDEFEKVEWESALQQISDKISQLREDGRQDRIALVGGEESQLFQDLASQFMEAVGSPHKAFPDPGILPFHLSQGLSDVPGYDLANCDLVLSFGLDLFESGAAPIHAISALIGQRRTEDRATTLHVGSRLSPSAAKAEHFVRINPGTHGALALGVAQIMVREDLFDQDFVSEHTFGFEDWEQDGRVIPGFRRFLIENYYPDRVAQICDCDPADIFRIARRFGQANSPVALFGGEASEASNATWTGLAVHSLNALTGGMNRAGGVTLAPQLPLAPLPDISPSKLAEKESLFRQDELSGDPLELLAAGVLEGTHPIELLIVLGANPLHETPAGSRLREAFKRIPLVVDMSSFLDETANHSDLILPLPIFLETWQEHTTPTATGLSMLGLSKPALDPLYDTRHAGDILLQLGSRLGLDDSGELPWADYPTYLKTRVMGLGRSGQGAVISGEFEENWKHFLEDRGWRFSQHSSPEDFWKELVTRSGWSNPVSAPANWSRFFQTPSGRFEFFSQLLYQRLVQAGRSDPEEISDGEALARATASYGLASTGPEVCLPHFEPPEWVGEGELNLVLFRPITARGQQAPASRTVMEMFGYRVLSGWTTWAEIHPETAHHLNIADGDHVGLESDQGGIEVVVHLHSGAALNTIHVPVGLGHPESFAGETVGSNPAAILAPVEDSLSGSLVLNATRVHLRLVRRRPHGGPAPHEGGSA